MDDKKEMDKLYSSFFCHPPKLPSLLKTNFNPNPDDKKEEEHRRIYCKELINKYLDKLYIIFMINIRRQKIEIK